MKICTGSGGWRCEHHRSYHGWREIVDDMILVTHWFDKSSFHPIPNTSRTPPSAIHSSFCSYRTNHLRHRCRLIQIIPCIWTPPSSSQLLSMKKERKTTMSIQPTSYQTRPDQTRSEEVNHSSPPLNHSPSLSLSFSLSPSLFSATKTSNN